LVRVARWQSAVRDDDDDDDHAGIQPTPTPPV